MLHILLLFVCLVNKANSQSTISLNKFADGIHHWYLFADNTNYKRFAKDDYISIANNILKYQNPDGGWPKNIDWLADVNADSLKATIRADQLRSTFDNDNTHPQIDFLAKMFTITGNKAFKESAERGFLYILNSQNKSGGWQGWDVDAITFNDNVTNGIMDLLLDVREKKEQFLWVGEDLCKQLDCSLNKAIVATLKCQIVVKGVKKAWCQQHSHKTYLPVKARTYELPSLASRESVNILRFLMRLPKDSVMADVIESAITWLECVSISNLRIEDIHIPANTYQRQNLAIDRIAVVDSTTKPIWARFYEIENDMPFMCTRAGEKVYKLSDVNAERRGGYAWYGYWPEQLINEEYPVWKAREY